MTRFARDHTASVMRLVLRAWAFPITSHQLHKELLRKLLLVHIYLFKFMHYVKYSC